MFTDMQQNGTNSRLD